MYGTPFLILACALWAALIGAIFGLAGYFLGARLICRGKRGARIVSQLLAVAFVAGFAIAPYLWLPGDLAMIAVEMLNLYCGIPAAIVAFVVASRAVS